MATADRKNLSLQSVPLRQLAKTGDGGFIGQPVLGQIQSEKLFHRMGIKQLFLGLCVGKISPDLQKAQFEDPQNQFGGSAWVLLLGSMMLDQFHQGLPGHHRVDDSQERTTVAHHPLAAKAAVRSEGPWAGVLPEYFSPHRLYPSEGFWEGMVS